MKTIHDNSSDIHWHKLKSIGVLYHAITFESILLFWHSFWCSRECHVSVSKLNIYKSIYLCMKRVASTTTNKKRRIGYPTFQNWKCHYDREFKTLSWLECETKVEEDTCVVTQLKCIVCTKVCSRIDSKQNFSHRWIIGAESIHTSNMCDHTQSKQHAYVHAMSLFNHELQQVQGKSSSAIAGAPIVVVLNSLSTDERTRKLILL